MRSRERRHDPVGDHRRAKYWEWAALIVLVVVVGFLVYQALSVV